MRNIQPNVSENWYTTFSLVSYKKQSFGRTVFTQYSCFTKVQCENKQINGDNQYSFEGHMNEVKYKYFSNI